MYYIKAIVLKNTNTTVILGRPVIQISDFLITGTKGFINITRGNPKHPIETKQSMATLVINVNEAYPPANYTL